MAFEIPRLGRRKHVFIDWSMVEPGYGVSWGDAQQGSWEMPFGVRIAAHQPRIDPEPLVVLEKPWEGAFTLHTTVFEDDGLYRLYYTVYDGGDSRGRVEEPGTYMLCYAESQDGVKWTKPSLGSVEFEGSKDNNLVYGLDVSLNRPVPTASVFKDPTAQPDKRYKMIHRGRQPDGSRCVYGAYSPDGLSWKAIEKPVVYDYFSDTQIGARFDEQKGCYVGYFRGWTGHESGRFHGRRTIAYAETEDFESWPQPETIVALDLNDNPGADIYTNAYTPWPDADAHLMFPAFYERQKDIRQVHLMTSRDGVRWERPVREPIIPSGDPGTSGDPARDWEAGVFAGIGLVSLQPDELSLTITPCRYSHNNTYDRPESLLQEAYPSPTGGYVGYICRATWRRDGFTSLEAETDGGFTTVPFTFEGGRLVLNAWTRYRGHIRVELVDASDESMSIPAAPAVGRSFDTCDLVTGHKLLSHMVTWGGESDLSAWRGKTVRLKFQMRRARLYAFHFE